MGGSHGSSHGKGTLMANKWMQEAVSRPGAFTKKAKAAGESVQGYARQVTAPGSQADTRTKRQANLAKTFARFSKRR